MVTTAVHVAVCIWLSVRRMEASGTGPKTPRGRLRELGWGLLLVALAVFGFLLCGSERWAPLAATAAAWLVPVLRPRLAAALAGWPGSSGGWVHSTASWP
jgi:hypothetical protein